VFLSARALRCLVAMALEARLAALAALHPARRRPADTDRDLDDDQPGAA